MESHEVMRKAVAQVGAKKVAAALKVSTSLVYKWSEAPPEEGNDSSGTRNPLDRVAALLQCTGAPCLVDWLCAEANGYFVANPDAEAVQVDASCLEHTQKMIQDFSELLRVISQSVADDGRVDRKEAEIIRQEWHDLKRYAEGFVRACEAGCFDG